MEMVIPNEFDYLFVPETQLDPLAARIRKSLASGLEQKAIINDLVEDGWEEEVLNWMVPYARHYTAPDRWREVMPAPMFASLTGVPELCEDIFAGVNTGEDREDMIAAAMTDDWDAALTGWIVDWITANGKPDKVTFPPRAGAASQSPVAPLPVASVPRVIITSVTPAATTAPTAEPLFAASGSVVSRTFSEISPLAGAFPNWDILPPQALVKRVRRSL